MWLVYVLIILFFILLLFAKFIMYIIFGKRCEGNPNLKYFTANDFEELNNKEIEFKSDKGQTLRGYIYTNKNIKEYKGLIIFVHGMGAGHLSYTTEINTLAKSGYKVMSYDNTGTCMSEGNSLVGFYQAVIDLKYALKFVKNSEELNKYDISLVGHSWGAYTVCQILNYTSDIKSVVAFSGPNTSSKLICDLLGGGKVNLRFLSIFFDIINFLTFGKKSLKETIQILKNTEVPVLLLHGDLDTTCSVKNSLLVNTSIFENKTNIKTILYENKYHNVYQTRESEKYLNQTFANISKLTKESKKDERVKEKLNEIYNNIDYNKITEEDSEVMEMVIEFLEK